MKTSFFLEFVEDSEDSDVKVLLKIYVNNAMSASYQENMKLFMIDSSD